MKIIIYTQANDIVAIIRPTKEALAVFDIEDIAKKDVPEGIPYKIVDATGIPTDRTFRDAWEIGDDFAINTNIGKAKIIAHTKRRSARAEELKSLDIQATIPSKAVQAENERQAIREKYAAMQSEIDGATTPDEIKIALAK